MTAPDLELAVGLSADELRTHVAPNARVHATGRWVAVERSETQIGISAAAEAGGCYRGVVVEKRLIARINVARGPLNAAQAAHAEFVDTDRASH
jgi:hypothetical protein